MCLDACEGDPCQAGGIFRLSYNGKLQSAVTLQIIELETSNQNQNPFQNILHHFFFFIFFKTSEARQHITMSIVDKTTYNYNSLKAPEECYQTV